MFLYRRRISHLAHQVLDLLREGLIVRSVIDGTLDDDDLVEVEGLLEHHGEVVPLLHGHADRPVALGEPGEIRIGIVQPEAPEPHVLLLPLDEPEGVVVQDQHDNRDVQPHRGLELLGVHHESAVAHHGKHPAFGMDQLGGKGRRQARTHGREGVVEDEGVRLVGAVEPREPEFVDAVVQGDDVVLAEGLPHVADDLLRLGREGRLAGRRELLGQEQPEVREQRVVPPRHLRGELPERDRDIADHFDGGVVVAVHISLDEIDMDDLLVKSRVPDEGRVLHDAVPHGDDHICAVDAAVHVVPLVDARCVEAVRRLVGEHALPHLRMHHVDARPLHEFAKLLPDELPVRPGG